LDGEIPAGDWFWRPPAIRFLCVYRSLKQVPRPNYPCYYADFVCPFSGLAQFFFLPPSISRRLFVLIQLSGRDTLDRYQEHPLRFLRLSCFEMSSSSAPPPSRSGLRGYALHCPFHTQFSFSRDVFGQEHFRAKSRGPAESARPCSHSHLDHRSFFISFDPRPR